MSMHGKHVNQAEVEAQATRLDMLGLINGKSEFYMPLDGSAALYLWIGYDVRC